MRVKAMLVALVGMIVLVSAHAEDLVTLGNETALLKMKTKREEARVEYERKRTEADRLTGTSSDGLPTVYAVEGVGSVLTAILQYENGSRLNVKPGQTIDAKGTKVVGIKAGDVTVKRGAQQFKLEMAPVSVAGGYSNPQPGGIAVPPGLPR